MRVVRAVPKAAWRGAVATEAVARAVAMAVGAMVAAMAGS